MQDDVTTVTEGDARVAPEVPQLEEPNTATSLQYEGNVAAMNAFNEYPALPEHNEAPSMELA